MLNAINNVIIKILNDKLLEIEKCFNSDMIFIYGPIQQGLEKLFLHVIEDISYNDVNKRNKLLIMLTTTGGSAITVERLVNISRKHYNEVDFIVPDYAYSAGTIFCMSGDNIYMDYYSVLGPIDPQVMNKDGKWVAALGYLDKVNELIEKSRNGTLTQVEYLLLKEMDLSELKAFEQAKELTIDLLKKWLVKYKFKNWTTHKSTGLVVTPEEKVDRARDIANTLNDYGMWKSHGRPLNIETLREIGLIIEDYGENKQKNELVRGYYGLIMEYIKKNGMEGFVHTRRFI